MVPNNFCTMSVRAVKPPSLHLLRALRAVEYARPGGDIHGNLHGHKLCQRRIPCPRFHSTSASRRVFSTASTSQSSPATKSSDRGPASKEDTQTDFGTLNVLGNTPPPSTSIDACLTDGFHLDNGVKIGGGSGCLLIAGEAFAWRPWESTQKGFGSRRGGMINRKGQWEVENDAWGVFDLVWPKPGMNYFL